MRIRANANLGYGYIEINLDESREIISVKDASRLIDNLSKCICLCLNEEALENKKASKVKKEKK